MIFDNKNNHFFIKISAMCDKHCGMIHRIECVHVPNIETYAEFLRDDTPQKKTNSPFVVIPSIHKHLKSFPRFVANIDVNNRGAYLEFDIGANSTTIPDHDTKPIPLREALHNLRLFMNENDDQEYKHRIVWHNGMKNDMTQLMYALFKLGQNVLFDRKNLMDYTTPIRVHAKDGISFDSLTKNIINLSKSF